METFDTLRWWYAKNFGSDEAEEDEEVEKKNTVYVILTAFIVFMIMSVVFGAGLAIGYFTKTFPIIDCSDDPPEPKPHQIREWNGDKSAGVYSLYKCSDLPSAPLTEVVMCNKSTQWQLILSIPCECRSDPLAPLGLSVFENSSDPTKHLSFTVTYKCNPSEFSPVALTTSCSSSRNWQPIDDYQNRTISPCNCSEKVPVVDQLQNTTTFMKRDPHENTFGSSLKIFCTNDTTTRLKEIYYCNHSATWQKVSFTNCLCAVNPPSCDSNQLRIWNNTVQSRKIGSEVIYQCTKNPRSYVYKTLKCDSKLKWSSNSSTYQMDECRSKYHIQTEPMTYDNASKWCKSRGGELLKTFSVHDERFMHGLMTQKKDTCKSFFLAAKEDVSERWWWLNRHKLDSNSTYWSEGFPRGVYECVIVLRSTLKWIIEDCRKPHCYLCEENHGSCFSHDRSGCVAMPHRVNFLMARSSCSNLGYSLIGQFPQNTTKLKKLRHSLSRLSVNYCPTLYIGLKLKHRIYRYDDGRPMYSQILWKEQSTLDQECVTMEKSNDFVLLSGAKCDSRACTICEFQGPDRNELKAV